MKRRKILIILAITGILALPGCSGATDKGTADKQSEAIEHFNTKSATEEDTSVAESEIKNTVELTAQNPDVQLNVGDQNKLFYTSNQDVTLTYTSSDDSVATVDDNGVVTAVGNGTATITASCDDASCEWTVTSTLNWGKMYADYFANDTDFQQKWVQNTAVQQIYLNNDDIPEIVVGEGGYEIYTVKDQQVVCAYNSENQDDGEFDEMFNYYKKTGVFSLNRGHLTSQFTNYYVLLNDGTLSEETLTYERTYYDENNEMGDDLKQYYKINDNETSKEEFDSKLSELTNGASDNSEVDNEVFDDEKYFNTVQDFINTYK